MNNEAHETATLSGQNVENTSQNDSNADQQRDRQRRQNNARAHRQRGRRGTNRNNVRSREGFFMHYLFITLSVRYATYFKPTARRMIEFFALIKAILMLVLLIYIHMTFVKESGNCLEHIEAIWPRTGVLKVQVEANTSLPPYQFFFEKQNSNDWVTSYYTSPYQAVLKYTVQLDHNGNPLIISTKERSKPRQTPYNALKKAREIFHLPNNETCPNLNLTSFVKEHARKVLLARFSEVTPDIEFLHMQKNDYPSWILEDPAISDAVAERKMLAMQELSGFNIGPQPVRSYYAIEYSTEFGYLRLSALTRHKLGIPVMVVTLDPRSDTCFGEGFKHWMMDTFFGYDDLIMGSIKQLAEKDNKQGGYLRNLVTGEHYKFITLWVSQASYLLAFAVMLVFTLVVTMLLRYSYHQIFVFMVELLHILDMDATPVFPAAPMLTIILALVGTEEIMTEFFHDSTLAFYVILSIWVADQFDAICMHTIVSRRHWVRFFFLYHFAFYAYHYRFNGQFSELALFTSWLFIQHSMFYFFHHYELPAIQRQMRLRQAILQNQNARPNAPPAPPTEPQDGSPTSGAGENESAPSQPGSEDPSTDSQGEANNNNTPAPENNTESATEGVNQESQTLCPVTSEESGLSTTQDSKKDDLDEEITILDPEHSRISETNTNLECDSENAVWVDELKVFVNDGVSEMEANIGHSSVSVFKYCNLIVFLFFAVVALLLVFALVVILLNQGRIGARFGPKDLDTISRLVR